MSPSAKKKEVSGSKTAGRASRRRAERGFTDALAALLRKRGLPVPKGLREAPAEAYASQPASYVERLVDLPNPEIGRFADQIAGFASRQEERARAEWEASPLIAELRRRKLKEPARPVRVTGISVSLAKPLQDWTDKEILHAAAEWSRIGRA